MSPVPHNHGSAVTVKTFENGPDIESAIVALADVDGFVVLESTSPEHRHGRYSILAVDPVRRFQAVAMSPDWIESLAAVVGKADARFACDGLPFAGGWIGYNSYEAGAAIESVHSRAPVEISLPDVYFCLYDTCAVYDHALQHWSLVAVDIDGYEQNSRSTRARRLDRLRRRMMGAGAPVPVDWASPAASEPRPCMAKGDYLNAVAGAKQHIEAGDICQVNLTQRFSAETEASPLEIYRRLRRSNPAPLSAFVRCGDSTVISASPELFLEVQSGRVVTRPIKGTRPRCGDRALDEIRVGELLSSEKDRAELNMIVDLLRNDLGRVSSYGTVSVDAHAELEAHPTVFHLVSTISGRLRRGASWSDLFRAALPGGSISGCPKIRAMQIIRDLEPTRRSVYCGNIGTIGLDGRVCMNIAIRTMVHERNTIHVFGGGAIVADSDPEDEYAETLAKIEGLMRALRGSPIHAGANP